MWVEDVDCGGGKSRDSLSPFNLHSFPSLAEHPSGFNLYRDCRRIFNVICICGRMSGSSSVTSFTRGKEFPSLTQIPQEKALVTPFNSEGASAVLLGRKCNYWNR